MQKNTRSFFCLCAQIWRPVEALVKVLNLPNLVQTCVSNDMCLFLIVLMALIMGQTHHWREGKSPK